MIRGLTTSRRPSQEWSSWAANPPKATSTRPTPGSSKQASPQSRSVKGRDACPVICHLSRKQLYFQSPWSPQANRYRSNVRLHERGFASWALTPGLATAALELIIKGGFYISPGQYSNMQCVWPRLSPARSAAACSHPRSQSALPMLGGQQPAGRSRQVSCNKSMMQHGVA